MVVTLLTLDPIGAAKVDIWNDLQNVNVSICLSAIYKSIPPFNLSNGSSLKLFQNEWLI